MHIKMKAPAGTGEVHSSVSGRIYRPDEDGVIVVPRGDVAALLGAGFTVIQEDEVQTESVRTEDAPEVKLAEDAPVEEPTGSVVDTSGGAVEPVNPEPTHAEVTGEV